MVRKSLCICQICTCGRHHCIHRPRENLSSKKRCLVTEYKDTFRDLPLSPAKPIKPDNSPRFSNQPFEGATMYKMTYVPHEYQQQLKKQPAQYVKPEGTTDYLSSYQRDYLAKYVGKAKSARPDYKPVASHRPFSGITVHKETYKGWDIPRVQSIHPPASSLRTSDKKFDHRTTFQSDFPGFYGNISRKMIKPPEPALHVGNGAIASETTTRVDYTKKNVAPEKSAKPPPNVVMHTDPFEHLTTAQHAFAWPDKFDPTVSCKPVQVTLNSTQPLEKDTTHSATYKEWKIEPQQAWKPQEGWRPAKDPFDHKTTFQHDFLGKQTAPSKSLKPEYIRTGPQGPFEDNTTHKETYRPWTALPREQYKPEHSYKEPAVPFEGRTTFQDDFQGFQSKRPDLCVPQENRLTVDGHRDFSTSYRETYLGTRPPSCPAKYLRGREKESDTPNYVYSHDKLGHQFYRRPEFEQVEIRAL